MTWEVFSILGIVAFAVSGAIVAMEEEYDIFGVFVLALVTAFGGGMIRNLCIGIPVQNIWQQGAFFDTALVSTGVVILLPAHWIRACLKWTNVFDALGLSAFAIQGALYASAMHYPLGAVLAAAVVTGIGGSVVRDVLAGRKPLVLRSEIYALWAMLAGLAIGLHWVQANSPWQLYVLLCVVFVLRILSIAFNWHMPRRKLATVWVDTAETSHFEKY